jgi:hypothetical protein
MLKNYGRLRESLEMHSTTLPSTSTLLGRSALLHTRTSFLSTPLLSLNQQIGASTQSFLQSDCANSSDGEEQQEEEVEGEHEDQEDDENELFVSIAPSSIGSSEPKVKMLHSLSPPLLTCQ